MCFDECMGFREALSLSEHKSVSSGIGISTLVTLFKQVFKADTAWVQFVQNIEAFGLDGVRTIINEWWKLTEFTGLL